MKNNFRINVQSILFSFLIITNCIANERAKCKREVKQDFSVYSCASLIAGGQMSNQTPEAKRSEGRTYGDTLIDLGILYCLEEFVRLRECEKKPENAPVFQPYPLF